MPQLTQTRLYPGRVSIEAEREATDHIRRVHEAHVARARRQANQLADEAALATEDGIRDLVDEDAEADAAVAAALVRQLSDRTMAAYRRLNDLESMGEAIAFGHTTSDDGETTYVGRISVIDGDDALVVDWRAAVAIPFYRATPLARLNVARRRHFNYDAGELSGYSDEILDIDQLIAGESLRGEAALLASVTAPTEQQMRSVVATIQAEQDAVVRAPSTTPLVVQGAPGTGKTVVALHRAAYLLYDQRVALADTGVLIVGPTNEFLRYISGVLPSLGESGVVSLTPEKLYAGVLVGPGPTTAYKGSADMVDIIRRAVRQRRRRPKQRLVLWYGSSRVVLGVARLHELFDQATGHRFHNDGADAFQQLVLDELVAAVFDPSFTSADDARDSFAHDRDLRAFLLRHWPPLTPEQALNDFLGSKALLRHAGVAAAEIDALYQERVDELELSQRRWRHDDVPLLDELYSRLGTSHGLPKKKRVVEEVEGVIFELRIAGADELDEQSATVAELSARERSWRYGHVIVDEAQDLTPMQWRMIARRTTDGGLTAVGDLAQRTIGDPGTWLDHLPTDLGPVVQRELTVNYRSPAEINDLAAGVLRALAPNLRAPRSIRRSGHPVAFVCVTDMANELGPIIEAHRDPDGRTGVIGCDQPLTPLLAKGLEFDCVIVVEPAAILAEPFGLSQLYIALTRATKRLVVVHQHDIPLVMSDAGWPDPADA
ncbi:MAG: AAA family ATPase [Acidimicrobiales bacterium]